MSYFRMAILLAGLTGLFMAVGYLVGGTGGAMIALVVAAGMNLFTYWNADRMVLSMHGAEEVDARTAPELVGMIGQLARNAGLPMPRVFLMHENQPNAFATGRNAENAAVAVTTGLLNSLTREELAGVIAHELAHIKNHDTLLMTITATIAGAISMVAQFGAFFSGNRENNGGPGLIGSLALMILAPVAAGCAHLRTANVACIGAGQNRRRGACGSQCACRTFTGDRAYVHYQPAVGARIAALQRLAAAIGAAGTGPSSPRATGPWNRGRGPWG